MGGLLSMGVFQVLGTSVHIKVLYVDDIRAGKLVPVHQVRGLKERIVK